MPGRQAEIHAPPRHVLRNYRHLRINPLQAAAKFRFNGCLIACANKKPAGVCRLVLLLKTIRSVLLHK